MVIATQSDASKALLQLSDDLNATAAQIQSYLDGVGVQNAAYPGLGAAMNYGSADVAGSAASLVLQLEETDLKIMGALTAPSDPLTPQQLAQLKELQKDVIDARSTVGTAISDVSWSLGGIFDDAVTSVENEASKIWTGLPNFPNLTPGWKFYVWAGIVVVAMFFIWRVI